MAESSQNLTCPACGSSNVQSRVEKREIKIPLAAATAYEAVVNDCSDCETTGDFAKVNDKNIAQILDQARKSNLATLINRLVEKDKMSMAYMERALDLPARTMMRWKSGEVSAGALALMRIVATYPFTVEVADRQFDSLYASKRLAQEGFDSMCRLADANQIAAKVVVSSYDQNSIQGTFSPLAMKQLGAISEEKNTRANWAGAVHVNRLPCVPA